MTDKTVIRSLLSAAIISAISGSAIADNSSQSVVDKGISISAGGTYTDYDSIRSLDNQAAPELGIGYRFNNRFSIEGVFSEYQAGQKNTAGDARIQNYRVDAYYDLKPWDGSLTPYTVAGIGEFNEHRADGIKNGDTRLNIGAGLRKSLTPNLSVQGDVRAVRSLDYGQTEGMMKLALNWTFGNPAPTAVAITAPVEKPVEQPVDADQDGIVDANDLCLGTEAGAAVDSTGCISREEINLLVDFDFDSAIIQDSDLSRIAEMGDYMKHYEDVQIRVVGHTDNSGPAAYNKALSQRRADAVRQMLINEFGIDGKRIEAIGMGESDPLAENSTHEGREENRRVVAEML